MSRKIVIDTGCLYRYGDDYKVLEVIKKAGFKYFDMTLFWKGTTEHIGLGDDYLENAKRLKEYADKLGLKCVQSHAFFSNNKADCVEIIKKDMRIASVLGAKDIVVHPMARESFEENIAFFKNFIPLAHELNINICVENIWNFLDDGPHKMCTTTPDEFVKFLDALNDNHVYACLDIGHAEMVGFGTSVEMVNKLGKRLKALHIHDNDCKHDSHQMPFTHLIHFGKLLDALKANNYKGNITFEVETCYNKGWDMTQCLPFELIPAFLKLELEIGKYFVSYLDTNEELL